MRKTLTFIFLIIVSTLSAFSQPNIKSNTHLADDYFKADITDEKNKTYYGIVDINDKVLLDFKYMRIMPVGENLISVSTDEKNYWLMTYDGKKVFPESYSSIKTFENGYVQVYKDYKFGLIDTKGKIILPFEYSYLSSYNDGVIAYRKDNLSGVMDLNKNIIIEPKDYSIIKEFNNGLAITSAKDTKGNIKWGIIDKKGNWKVAPQFDGINLANGFYKTELKKFNGGEKVSGGWKKINYLYSYGYIDIKNNLELTPQYESLWVLSNGNAFVKKDKKHYLIDIKNKVLATFNHITDKPSFINQYNLKIQDSATKKYAILNMDGKQLTDYKYNTIYGSNNFIYAADDYGIQLFSIDGKELYSLKDGKVLTWNDDKAILADKEKLQIFDVKNNKISQSLDIARVWIARLTNNALFIETDKVYSIYKLKNKKQIPTDFQEMKGPSDDGLFLAKHDYKYGVVDENNKIIIPTNNQSVISLNNNRIIVKESNTSPYSIYDTKGKKLFEISNKATLKQYSDDYLMVVENKEYSFLDLKGNTAFTSKLEAGDFANDRVPFVSTNKLIGFYDKKGNIAIQPAYTAFGNFSKEGYAGVQDATTKKWGFINKKGEPLFTNQYTKVYSFAENTAVVMEKNLYGVINNKGEEVLPVAFHHISPTVEGMFGVQKDSKGQWAFFNTKGQAVTDYVFDNVSTFKDGVCWTVKEGKLTLIDKKGKILINSDYKNVNSFVNGAAVVVNKAGKYGIIDKSNKIIVPFEYDAMGTISNDGTVIIVSPKTWRKIPL
ncbi:MAG: WG repeat-containing protein [Niabella sp.]